MRSSFDHPPSRSGGDSLKWNAHPAGVLPLWVADMDFASPPAVLDALTRRAEHGVFGYATPPRSLAQTVCAHLLQNYDWRVEPDWLVWLPSVVPGLNLACRALTQPGEAVMTITPVYPPFLQGPPHQGRELIAVHAAHDGERWRLPIEAMEAAVTPQTRLFLLCHPHNPLGRAWSDEELVAVVEFCRRHNLALCSDEIHCDLLLDPLVHRPAATLPGAEERAVTLMSPSKTFNLPGLGFAFAVVADPELRRRFTEQAKGLLPFVNCFAIAGAEAAYRDGAPWLAELLGYLRENRDLVEQTVAERLPGVTMTHVEATYLAWLDVRALELPDAAQACLDAGVALSDGASFGDPGYLRLNFACPQATLREALDRLRRALGGS